VRSIFQNLPDEFSPPDRAAEHLVKELKTRAEREAYWLRIPEAWRYYVGYIAALMFGHELCGVTELAARRAALEEVPAFLRPKSSGGCGRCGTRKRSAP
jgi:hypothetical protein